MFNNFLINEVLIKEIWVGKINESVLDKSV